MVRVRARIASAVRRAFPAASIPMIVNVPTERRPSAYVAETLYVALHGRPAAGETRTRSGPSSDIVTPVKSQTTSGNTYAAGSPIS